jgi:hypothetical protein
MPEFDTPEIINVPDLCSLAEQPIGSFVDGALAFVSVSSEYYRFSGSSALPVNLPEVLSTPNGPAQPGCATKPIGTDPARWIRMPGATGPKATGPTETRLLNGTTASTLAGALAWSTALFISGFSKTQDAAHSNLKVQASISAAAAQGSTDTLAVRVLLDGVEITNSPHSAGFAAASQVADATWDGVFAGIAPGLHTIVFQIAALTGAAPAAYAASPGGAGNLAVTGASLSVQEVPVP